MVISKYNSRFTPQGHKGTDFVDHIYMNLNSSQLYLKQKQWNQSTRDRPTYVIKKYCQLRPRFELWTL